MSLTTIQHGTGMAELEPWGKLSDLGAQILEGGEVAAFGKMTCGAPTDAVSAGYFGTTRGKFRLVYPFSEQATVVTGELRITDESTGETRTFKAGDSWFVTKGTSTLWEVISDSFVKHYLAIV
ncbi:cupin domain-containing protein [Paraburkholderia acidipaludis]|uniref:cupin domain-containing protein n=1 Tax=Paraburkholderia acidipaludis TaxID=660537 RepID=UPI0004813D16|nr:cupin domain-containing protein [Paraburkholderia acidipaludis]